ncbi:hypothetical protein BSL78_14718 [Apostichopus japonicus]|uniref:Fibronectin type-III domain-containing protein n=1 Tax=Stichopus japonicus TaxID=307972 RepID=A0A2G8KKB8_STIJA|nr:hypothetical protein BSL78_14718 [Apostichopus japonicus]
MPYTGYTYEVHYHPTDETRAQNISSRGSQRSLTISNLQTCTEYSISVSIINAVGRKSRASYPTVVRTKSDVQNVASLQRINFCPTPPSFDQAELSQDVTHFFSRIRLREFFLDDPPTEREPFCKKRFLGASTRVPVLEAYTQVVSDDKLPLVVTFTQIFLLFQQITTNNHNILLTSDYTATSRH